MDERNEYHLLVIDLDIRCAPCEEREEREELKQEHGSTFTVRALSFGVIRTDSHTRCIYVAFPRCKNPKRTYAHGVSAVLNFTFDMIGAIFGHSRASQVYFLFLLSSLVNLEVLQKVSFLPSLQVLIALNEVPGLRRDTIGGRLVYDR